MGCPGSLLLYQKQPSAGRNGLEPLHFQVSNPLLGLFQYPLRVEMDWNLTRNVRLEGKRLSFSTLCGSKWIGTSTSESDGRGWCVSVPSAGRNGLEPMNAKLLRSAVLSSFSTLCGSKWIGTRTAHAGDRTLARVSVPSAGRNGLELVHLMCLCQHHQKDGFSTLCGSKWIGTVCGQSVELLRSLFQYPLRVEMDWNYLSTRLAALAAWFQYPLRVEMD